MTSELRQTGISVVGEMPWGTHFCHFYETKQDLLDTLVPYFKAGLESKEFCLWVVSDSDLITVEEAKQALAQAVPDLYRHLSDENIEIVNGRDWYFEKNVLNLERVASAWAVNLKRALARGYNGLRASGDTFWLAEKDWKDCFAYEKQVNDWVTDQPMTVLCTYPLAKSGAAEVLDVVQAHQFVIARRQGEWEAIETPQLRQAKAEIKKLNEELEQRVIERTNELRAVNEELRKEIAERKQAEDELRRQKEILQKIFDHIPVMINFVEADGRIKLVNREWERTLGWSLEEIRQQNLDIFAECYPDPDYRQQVLKFVAKAKGEWADFKTRVRDGRVMDTTWVRVHLSDGTSIGIGRDITGRKHAEALLHAKEQEFRAIVENAPDQIIRYDREFRRTYVNPAVAKAYGLPAEALTGKPIGSVIQDAGLDVKEDELAQVHKGIAAVFDTGQSYEYELTWPLPTGSRYYSVRLFPELDLNGSVSSVLGIARDITERKQAEDALRRSEDHLRLVIDAIPTMAWSLGTDGVVDFLNQRWMDYTGLSLEQFIEEPTRPIHPEDIPRVIKKWRAQMAVGEGYEEEMRLRRADGEYRWFLVRTAPLRDEQANLVKWYGASIDIEDRKRAEEKLKQSESQLAEAQHMAQVGSWNWDLQSNAMSWSDELYRIFGIDPKAFNPAYESFVAEFVHPEDRALVRGVVESSLKTQQPFSLYNRILRPDGERVIHARGNIVSDENGNPIRAFGTAQDVTERKQAEEALREAEQKYRDIFENAGEGIFQSTPEGRYIVANPALARMYRFASPEELIHSRQDISLQVYVDPTRREEFKRQLEEQGAVRGFEHEVFRKDGSRLWISVNAHAVRDEQGAIQYYEGIAQDINERKAAEEELKATSEHLRALSARLQSAREEEGTRIAREIHDELGSALTSLKWDLEEIDKQLSTPLEPLALVALREKFQTPMKLADLAITAIRRIASELRPSVLDDLGLVAAIEWQAQQFQARTGIVCHCDCSLEKGELSEEQSTAVFRILQEALTNVLRHAQATKVDIKINEEKGYFVLSVSDNGKGITESEKSQQQCLGILGMRERAHLIAGEIEIKGVKGKGTVVIVRVPISGQDAVLKMTR